MGALVRSFAVKSVFPCEADCDLYQMYQMPRPLNLFTSSTRAAVRRWCLEPTACPSIYKYHNLSSKILARHPRHNIDILDQHHIPTTTHQHRNSQHPSTLHIMTDMRRMTMHERKEFRAALLAKQDEALSALPTGGLYISMFCTLPPPDPTYHWGFYLHMGGVNGRVYHIHGSTGQGWHSAHKDTHNALRSLSLTCYVKIGQIPTHAFDRLHQIMQMYDQNLNGIAGISCRVWLFMIVRELIRDGLVRSNGSMAELEAECRAFAGLYNSGAGAQQQPRPIVASRICS